MSVNFNVALLAVGVSAFSLLYTFVQEDFLVEVGCQPQPRCEHG